MTKSEIISALAARQKLTQKQATQIINIIINGFIETLSNGDRIEIRGFGSYSIREHFIHTGKNPKAGEKIAARKKKLPFFKAGKELKKIVDSKKVMI